MKMLAIFPFATLFNSFSMTALLLVFGLTGHAALATDIGLIQGATLAFFYAFSANARNLILADASDSIGVRLLQARLLLMLPLAGATYFLGVSLGTATAPLAMVLIVRRMSEWMGEIGLARHERMNQPAFALQTIAGECFTFFLCLLLPLWLDLNLAVSAIPWALAPLLAIRKMRMSWRGAGRFPFGFLLPHFGSTAITGISVYVFRVSIVLLVDKLIAGELFTAFAIGGAIPSIFAQVLAPTLTYRLDASGFPNKLRFIPIGMLLLGSGIAVLAITKPAQLLFFGHSPMFWLAAGLSIVGGALMCVAAALRTRLIQQTDGGKVFGADLLANLLISTCVPFVFYALGPRSLAGLYILSSCFSLVFLWSAGHGRGMRNHHLAPSLFGIGILLVLPVFLQINGGLFRDPSFIFDTSGSFSRLPIPVSVLALFGGIALLGNYIAALWTLTVLFFSALLFVMSSFLSTGSLAQEGAKLILLAQFLMPMFGLILGQMYGAAEHEPVFERTALWMLLLVVPLHLLATWFQGYLLLSPYVFAFSIYQHLQYFPSVVVALGLMGLFTYAKPGSKYHPLTMLVSLSILTIHVVASRSFSAIVGLLVGYLVFLIWSATIFKQMRTVLPIILTAVAIGGVYGYIARAEMVSKFRFVQSVSESSKLPLSVSERMGHWRFYANGVIESPRTFLIGHATPPNRNVHPSAHNYWLDALYNFGAVALLPLIILLLGTLRLLWRRRAAILENPILLGIALAATYLLLFENTIKVGMRQPYPGIITFFIWGLLIARLQALDISESAPTHQHS